MNKTIDEIKEEINDLEIRASKLQRSKDKIIGKLAIEESKRKAGIEVLKKVYPDIEEMDSGSLKSLQEELLDKLNFTVDQLTKELDSAEVFLDKIKDI